MEQIVGIVTGAQPTVYEEVVRNSLRKSVMEPEAEQVDAGGIPLVTEEESRASEAADAADSRRARTWMATYNLFLLQGYKEDKAREAVERDPQYLRLKDLVIARVKAHQVIQERWDKRRLESACTILLPTSTTATKT